MRWFHWLAFGSAFFAAVMAALAGEYGEATQALFVCVWVHIAAGNSRDARRYHFIKKYVRVDMKNIETGEVTKAGGESLDAIVDQHINQ